MKPIHSSFYAISEKRPEQGELANIVIVPSKEIWRIYPKNKVAIEITCGRIVIHKLSAAD